MIPGTAVKSEDLSHTTVTDQNEPPPLTKRPRFFYQNAPTTTLRDGIGVSTRRHVT